MVRRGGKISLGELAISCGGSDLLFFSLSPKGNVKGVHSNSNVTVTLALTLICPKETVLSLPFEIPAVSWITFCIGILRPPPLQELPYCYKRLVGSFHS